MRPDEAERIAAALGRAAVGTRTLAGGFSHETSLLTLSDSEVVVRLGGTDPEIEAAVMAAAARQVPVPAVLRTLPNGDRPAMVLEYVSGTPLNEVLAADDLNDPAGLGAEVGRVVGLIGAIQFDHPGFFIDPSLTVRPEPPWSQQLPEIAAACTATTSRLDKAERQAWAKLCSTHAPALAAIDSQARLVHADINPKNILVTWNHGWQVSAILDWEFSYSGCPYGDAANMARFGDMYPLAFLEAFLETFGQHTDHGNWLYLGRVLDMFALSDLITRPPHHPVADQAAAVIQQWLVSDVPTA